MLTNPLVTTPAIPTDGDRPTLRIAARATPVAGDADPAVAPSTTHEAGGWKADVAGLLEKITAGAAADAAQAAAQARAQAQIQITELEQKIIALQSNMDSLRTSGETERSELQRQCRERVSAAESLVETLRAELAGHKAELLVVRQQLEAAIAERSKLTATFRLVQRALALTTTEGLPDMTDMAASTATSVEAMSPQRSAEHAAAAPIIEAAPKPDESAIVVINAPQEAIDDVRRVLEQVEAMYLQDLESGRSGIEIADRLTASLRHARAMILARWSTGDLDAPGLFEQHMGLLLDKHNGTLFGRHLSIAAYASRTTGEGEIL